MLTSKKTVENGKALFALEGMLDTLTVPELEKELRDVIGGLTELTWDFSKLEYMSSAGLRLLLSSQKIMNRQGSMKVVNVNRTVMGILETTGFTDILTIE